MNIKDAVVLVTGANRGLGKAFVDGLLAAGAKKVYAGARDPASVAARPGVVPVALDVTRADTIAAAAKQCGDTSIVINNAGISRGGAFLGADAIEIANAEFATNFFGPLAVAQAFAPILEANGGGAMINVLSVLSWLNTPFAATYCASKAAAWSLTNGLRHELRAQGTQVVALHVGFMDTDMTKGIPGEKADPRDVVRQTLAVLEAGGEEVLADAVSHYAKSGLSAERATYLQEIPH